MTNGKWLRASDGRPMVHNVTPWARRSGPLCPTRCNGEMRHTRITHHLEFFHRVMHRHRPAQSTCCKAALAVLCAAVIATTAGGPPRPPARPPLENLVFVEPDLISGSAPGDDAAFAYLAALGVRTVISVEAFPPDVQAARRYGLRYVHLPIRYDGMTADELLRLAYALHTLPRPIYVHCFHGRHRAPAAVAAAEVVLGRLSVEQAEAVLEAAGTSPSYPGLFAALDTAARLDPAWLECVAGPLPERLEPPPLLLAMGRIDRTWNQLREARDRHWRGPDRDADALATLADQLARELRRASDHVPPRWQADRLAPRLASAARRAERLAAALRAGRWAEASRLADRVQTSCRQCHADTRNRLPSP